MAFTYINNNLCCNRVVLEDLAKEYQTPLFVYDLDAVAAEMKRYQTAFQPLAEFVAFAVKANSNLSLLKHLAQLDCGFDVVSKGELFRVIQAGGDVSKVIFSGVGKTDDDITYALENNIALIAVESAEELANVARIATQKKSQARIGIRINPKVDAKTHPYITTGTQESKFGIPEEEAIALYRKYLKHEYLDLCAVTFHVGSQIVTLDPFTSLVDIAIRISDTLIDLGVPLRRVDLGGGLGISYRGEEPPSVESYASQIKDAWGDRKPRILLEPGRSIVGNAGVLLTKVLYHKSNGSNRFTVIDASMGELIRPSLYSAYHGVQPLKEEFSSTTTKQTWVGPICESTDFLAKDRVSAEVPNGEYVAFMSAGAYGFTMASNYNSRCRPAEIGVVGSEARVIRKRETLEDLIRGEAL